MANGKASPIRPSTRDDRPRGDGDRRREDKAADGNSRDRSRSPRRERGGRRSDNNRYRSRSPLRRGDRPSGRDNPRSDGDAAARGRDPPKGPSSSVPSSRDAPGRDRAPDRKPAFKTDIAPAAKPSVNIKRETAPDVKMSGTGPTDATTGGDAPLLDIDPETLEMIKVMGFGMFKSTKETKVPGNDKNWAIRTEKKMEARQYMNRQGGFNRPLSPGH